MSTPLETQPAARKLSAVDVFCMQTYESTRGTPAEASPRSRRIAYALSAFCLVLAVGLGFAAWWGYSIQQDREELFQQLANERAGRIKAELSVRDAEFRLANYALETRVRRDVVDKRMSEQERRAAELEEEAAKVRLAKLAEADCITPRSVIAAAGL